MGAYPRDKNRVVAMCRAQWVSFDISTEGRRTVHDERGVRRIYELTVNKREYPDFEGWLWDMERSAMFYREYVPER